MWWMIAQAAAGVVQDDQNAAAQVYGDMTAYLAAKDASMRGMSDAQAMAGAIVRDKAMSSLEVNKKQREAQAQAELGAGFAGSTGSAVTNVIYSTKANAAYMQGATNMQLDIQLEQSLEDVYAAAYTWYSTRYEPPTSKLGRMLKGALTVGVNPLDGQAYADSLSM
jgi:hypothetical protein